MAAGIGSARALVIVQVDLPAALKIPSTAPERIDTYAARVLSANRHTTVYIDGGTFGWTSATNDAELLIRNGIRYARGFALDDTDYDPTATEDEFGAKVIAALAKLGVRASISSSTPTRMDSRTSPTKSREKGSTTRRCATAESRRPASGPGSRRPPTSHRHGGTSAPRPRRMRDGTATATSGRGNPGTSITDRSYRSMRCGSLRTGSTRLCLVSSAGARAS